jgi:hypothetical protein
MEHKSQGICRFCLKTFSGAGMGRHLLTCKARKEKCGQELKSAQRKYKNSHIGAQQPVHLSVRGLWSKSFGFMC